MMKRFSWAVFLLLLLLLPTHAQDTVTVSYAANFKVIVVPAAGPAPVIDCGAGSVFVLTLSQVVTSSTIINVVPGKLYTFEIRQGATPFSFVWPANFYAPQGVQLKSNGITIEIGVGLTDDSVLGIGGASA